jgi:hypothetical protein
MPGTAYDSWTGESEAPRWDQGVLLEDRDHSASLAKEHANELGIKVGGFEDALSDRPAEMRAKMRDKYAPMYYDLHRATLASDPKRVAEHLRTRKLAEAMAARRPENLSAARSMFDEDDMDDVDRQYFLWKHSLAADDRFGSWMPPPQATASRVGLAMRTRDPKDLAALDDALGSTYGLHTRSPKLARVGFAFAHPNGALRGFTNKRNGNMVLGTLPGADPRTIADNRKTMVEEMAHSIVARHGAEDAKRYGAWLHTRSSVLPDRQTALPAFAAHLGMPERKDYGEDLAHTMSHGLFDEPSGSPHDEDAPSDEAVGYASRLFRREPAHDPSHFRMFV